MASNRFYKAAYCRFFEMSFSAIDAKCLITNVIQLAFQLVVLSAESAVGSIFLPYNLSKNHLKHIDMYLM